MTCFPGSDPILDCAAAAAFEQSYFDGDEAREWDAMQRAGTAVADALLRDLQMAGVPLSEPGRVLLLVGKGHNGGDALLAGARLLARTSWTVEVGFVFGQNRLRPLAVAAWRKLQHQGGAGRVKAVRSSAVEGQRYLAVLDGVFGFQFRSPLPDVAKHWFGASQGATTRFRGSVDLPSGLDEDGAFVADATYATGILKSPLLSCPGAGRLRYLDLGFFELEAQGKQRVLKASILDPLRALRPVGSDKRSYGQLAVIGGSRAYPGAVGLSVAAALLSGVGNVMAFVPESQAAAFAARWPEAMWMGCAETEEGSIAMEAGLDVRRHLQRASALLIGPGLGREPETMALVAELIRDSRIPLVLDADALQADLVRCGDAVRILTPHAGELARLKLDAGEMPENCTIVRKGPITRIEHENVTYHSIEGGPGLARGGSGDMLAGLIGGRLAATPDQPAQAAMQATFWHGRAARRLGESQGEVSVRNSALIDHLNPVLREGTTD